MASRLASGVVLALSLGATGFGIATAIFLEHPTLPLLDRAPDTTVALPAAPPDPMTAAAAAPVGATPEIPEPPAIEPPAGSGQSQPTETAALEPPPPAAPPPAAAPVALSPPPPAPVALSPPPAPVIESKARYWVEYGAFAGPTYARRLQQALSQQGLDAVVVATHGRDGRRLLRVRSAAPTDLAGAREAAREARSRLHIATLLHRGDPAAAPEPRYWVQFGAFAKPKAAARLRRELRRGGVATSVSSLREASGKSLYLVRSAPVADHAEAVALGERGRELAQVDFLVGERTGYRYAQHTARAPPRSVTATR